MLSMCFMAKNAGTYCLSKVDAWFKRVFKEQAGGAELIATLVIIGVVLCLAFIFKDMLIDLVKNLWNTILDGGNKDAQQGSVVDEWQ